MTEIAEKVTTHNSNLIRRDIPAMVIAETLSIYKDEVIGIEAATWDGRTLEARLQIFPYPFTHAGILPYLTTPMVVLFVSQLAYLHGRLHIEDRLPLCGATVSLEDYFRLRDSGALLTTNLTFRGRRQIYPSNCGIQASFTLVRLKRTSQYIFATYEYDISSKAMYGRVTTAMPVSKC